MQSNGTEIVILENLDFVQNVRLTGIRLLSKLVEMSLLNTNRSIN